jgi:hypothetical protein
MPLATNPFSLDRKFVVLYNLHVAEKQAVFRDPAESFAFGQIGPAAKLSWTMSYFFMT